MTGQRYFLVLADEHDDGQLACSGGVEISYTDCIVLLGLSPEEFCTLSETRRQMVLEYMGRGAPPEEAMRQVQSETLTVQ